MKYLCPRDFRRGEMEEIMKQISDMEKRDLIDLLLGFKYLSEGFFEDEIDSYPNLQILIQEGLGFFTKA